MARETGSGITPPRVVDELNRMLLKYSLNAISKATGVGVSALHRYQRGVGEPTTATLGKLAGIFGVSVPWLRGEVELYQGDEEAELHLKMLNDLLELYKIAPERLQETVVLVISNARKEALEKLGICSLAIISTEISRKLWEAVGEADKVIKSA